jgi:hypothetical protein
MNSNAARWELNQPTYNTTWAKQYTEAPHASLPYAFPEQAVSRLAEPFDRLSLDKVPKTRTSPVATRTKIVRHGSHNGPARPSSSGGEANVPPNRLFASTRRSGSYSQPTPFEESRGSRQWPPRGYRQDDALDARQAEEWICAGASTFEGYGDAMQNAPAGYKRFYAVMSHEHQGRTDRASFQKDAYRDISLNLMGASESQFPWLSLEQPCMAYAFGKSAGTSTLNYWASKSGSNSPPSKRTGEATPRKMKLLQILDRLQSLEGGLGEDVSLQLHLEDRIGT